MEKWILLASIAVRVFLFSGSVKANGVVLLDIVRYLGSAITPVSTAFGLQNGIAYMISPVCLLLMRVVSTRQLCIFGGVITGLGYIFCGFFLEDMWQVFVGFTMSGIGFGLSTMSSWLMLREHFDIDEMAKVISFVCMFDFVGVAVMPLILQFFLSNYGLKHSLILFGAVLWNNILCGVAAKMPRNKQVHVEPYKEEEHDTKSGLFQKINIFVMRCYTDVSTLFRHKNITTLLVLEFAGFYIFLSWALFLVPLGTAAGLRAEQAVTLSTAGGIGGFVGRLLSFALFQINKVDAVTSGLMPFLFTSLSLLGLAFSTDMYIMAALAFISGASQGLNSSAVFSLIPTTVCKDHYQTVVALECFGDGMAIQLSGIVSGVLMDMTGSAVYVYAFNSVFCFLTIPLIIYWWFDQTVDLDCTRID